MANCPKCSSEAKFDDFQEKDSTVAMYNCPNCDTWFYTSDFEEWIKEHKISQMWKTYFRTYLSSTLGLVVNNLTKEQLTEKWNGLVAYLPYI